MAVGLSGWGQQRAPRESGETRVDAHLAVLQTETALLKQQAALRTALTKSTGDAEELLASMTRAEDALIAARRAWAASAGVDENVVARRPSSWRLSSAFERSLTRARTSSQRPTFTHGSWV